MLLLLLLCGTLGAESLVLGDVSTVKKRLWTKADYLHLHAISGAVFLAGGTGWMASAELAGSELNTESSLGLLGAGVVNALTAVPMTNFKFDFSNQRANGFAVGGAGLTIMSCWMSWWFSGAYPDFLQPLNPAFFALWTSIIVGSTVTWEQMSADGPGEKWLNRVASYPNLTQLFFLWNMASPDSSQYWLAHCVELWPNQRLLLHHYGLTSALGYALSMFGETLRDRKLVTLRTDFVILLASTIAPMLIVFLDASLLPPDTVTVLPTDYWRMFAN